MKSGPKHAFLRTDLTAILLPEEWAGRNGQRTWVLYFLFAFLFLIAAITMARYQDFGDFPHVMFDLNPNASALPPFRFRLFYACLYQLVLPVFPAPFLADYFVQFGSIFFCYFSCYLLFVRASRDFLFSLLNLITFFATLFTGQFLRHRTEFFEAGFVALCLWFLLGPKRNWWVLALITLPATLNKETWLLALVASFAFLGKTHGSVTKFVHSRRDLGGWLICFVLYVTVQGALRLRFGSYVHGIEVDRFVHNLGNIFSFHLISFWTLGLGIVWVYLISLTGPKPHVHVFVLTYLVALFVAAFVFGLFGEQRIFISAYPLLLASLSQTILMRAERRSAKGGVAEGRRPTPSADPEMR